MIKRETIELDWLCGERGERAIPRLHLFRDGGQRFGERREVDDDDVLDGWQPFDHGHGLLAQRLRLAVIAVAIGGDVKLRLDLLEAVDDKLSRVVRRAAGPHGSE